MRREVRVESDERADAAGGGALAGTGAARPERNSSKGGRFSVRERGRLEAMLERDREKHTQNDSNVKRSDEQRGIALDEMVRE